MREKLSLSLLCLSLAHTVCLSAFCMCADFSNHFKNREKFRSEIIPGNSVCLTCEVSRVLKKSLVAQENARSACETKNKKHAHTLFLNSL